MQLIEIEYFEKPLQIGHYKCVVCENPELAKGYDMNKGEFIYINQLHKVEISMHWIFFCDSCWFQLKKEVRSKN